MLFLLGRYEKSANEFYKQYVENNKKFSTVPMKKMSKLTNNLLHAIDYEKVKKIRTQNYLFLFNELKSINKLDLKMIKGAFAYPLWVKNGNKIRQDLAKKKIYIPLLWPNVLDNVNNNSLEYEFAQNILPIPCDQRYNIEDMRYICEEIKKMIFEKEDDKND